MWFGLFLHISPSLTSSEVTTHLVISESVDHHFNAQQSVLFIFDLQQLDHELHDGVFVLSKWLRMR